MFVTQSTFEQFLFNTLGDRSHVLTTYHSKIMTINVSQYFDLSAIIN